MKRKPERQSKSRGEKNGGEAKQIGPKSYGHGEGLRAWLAGLSMDRLLPLAVQTSAMGSSADELGQDLWRKALATAQDALRDPEKLANVKPDDLLALGFVAGASATQ